MKFAAVMVGNSSSGILEAASFKLPVINVGTRQHGRTRAGNVIDAGYDREAIKRAVQFALDDAEFRRVVERCVNPYGDGNTAARTVDILRRHGASDSQAALLVEVAYGLLWYRTLVGHVPPDAELADAVTELLTASVAGP